MGKHYTHIIYIIGIVLLVIYTVGCPALKESKYESEIMSQNHITYDFNSKPFIEEDLNSSIGIMHNSRQYSSAFTESINKIKTESTTDTIPYLVLPKNRYKHIYNKDTLAKDLSEYFPIPKGQGVKALTCVSYSLAYALNSYFKSFRLKRPTDLYDSLSIFDPYPFHDEISSDFDEVPSTKEGLVNLFENGSQPMKILSTDNLDSIKMINRIAGAAEIDLTDIKKKDLRKLMKRFIQDNTPIVIEVGPKILRFCCQDSGDVWHKKVPSCADEKNWAVSRHAMLIVGYDDSKGNKGAFKLFNSLSNSDKSLCKGGYGWLCYGNLKEIISMYICFDQYPYADFERFERDIFDGKKTYPYVNHNNRFEFTIEKLDYKAPISELSAADRIEATPTIIKIEDPVKNFFLNLFEKFPLGFEKHVPAKDVDSQESLKTICASLDKNGQFKTWGKFESSLNSNPTLIISGLDKKKKNIIKINAKLDNLSSGRFEFNTALEPKNITQVDTLILERVLYENNNFEELIEINQAQIDQNLRRILFDLSINKEQYESYVEYVLNK